MQTGALAIPNLPIAAKQRIQQCARTPDQMAFFHVAPSESGISSTMWVSQNEAWPALLVSQEPGRLVDPPEHVLVVGFDEITPFAEVNAWLACDGYLLPRLARQEIAVGEFYDAMRKPRGA